MQYDKEVNEVRTNQDKLVRALVSGTVRHTTHPRVWSVGRDGVPNMLDGCGGIIYNVRVGDSVYDWAADHVEPGASTGNYTDDMVRISYYFLSCMGNRVEVIGGKAEGAVGYVVAKHAGVFHVVVDLHEQDLKKMRLNDPVQVEVYGTGLQLLDYPDILVTSIDPLCLEKMNIQEVDGNLHIPVAGVVPAELLGSGMGSDRPMGDVDFMASDRDYIKECGLEELKLGDVVMLKDIDCRYGPSFKRGAASVGIIVHGDSPKSGHGPGVTTFMATAAPLLVPVIDKTANISKYHRLAYGDLKPLPDKAE